MRIKLIKFAVNSQLDTVTSLIYLPEVGQVTLQKSRRNKRIRLTLKPTGEIKVTLPLRCSFKQAQEFVLNNKAWILKNIQKVQSLAEPDDIRPKEAVMFAETYLPERIELLSQKTGLKYKDLKLVNVKRYWGKCMGDNSIKLNVNLMRLPYELIDYVILHELAHTKVKDHSPRFYEFLGTLVAEPKRVSKNLKKYALAGCLR